MMASRCLLAFIVLAAAPAHAEPSLDEDPATAARRLSPRNDSVYMSSSQIFQPSLSLRDLRLSVGAPVIKGDGYGIGLFARYAATWMEGDQLASDLTLHRFDLMLGGGGRLVPGWSLRGALGVSYGSDLQFDSPQWGAFGVTAAAIINHPLGPSDALLFGVAYASDSTLYPVLPILGYVHQAAGSRFRFDAQLPRHVRVSYTLTPRLQATLGVEVRGDKWLVRGMHTPLETRRAGGSAYAELGIAATDLVRVDVRAGISVDKFTLPDVMTDTTHDGSLGVSGFLQLLAAVTR